MIAMSINLVEDFTKELERRLKELEKLGEVDVGWFAQTGTHKDSGFNFPTLASYHAHGNPSKNTPPRPVLEIAYGFNPLKKSPLKSSLNKYLSNIRGKSPVKAEWVAKKYAAFYVTKTQMLFGDTSALARNADSTVEAKAKDGVSPAQNPLVWTGSLRDNVTYSIGGRVF